MLEQEKGIWKSREKEERRNEWKKNDTEWYWRKNEDCTEAKNVEVCRMIDMR